MISFECSVELFIGKKNEKPRKGGKKRKRGDKKPKQNNGVAKKYLNEIATNMVILAIAAYLYFCEFPEPLIPLIANFMAPFL